MVKFSKLWKWLNIFYLELMEEQEVVDDRRSLGYDLSFEEDERSS